TRCGARKSGAFQEGNAQSGLGALNRRRGPCRPTANDGYIDVSQGFAHEITRKMTKNEKASWSRSPRSDNDHRPTPPGILGGGLQQHQRTVWRRSGGGQDQFDPAGNLDSPFLKVRWRGERDVVASVIPDSEDGRAVDPAGWIGAGILTGLG